MLPSDSRPKRTRATATATTTTRGSVRDARGRARRRRAFAFPHSRRSIARASVSARQSARDSQRGVDEGGGVRGDRARDRKKQSSIPPGDEVLVDPATARFRDRKNQSNENVSMDHTDRLKCITIRSNIHILLRNEPYIPSSQQTHTPSLKRALCNHARHH